MGLGGLASVELPRVDEILLCRHVRRRYGPVIRNLGLLLSVPRTSVQG
jgi:hypothetical protein